MKSNTDGLKTSLKNCQQKASDQFKDLTESDWPDTKDHMTEEGRQAGNYLKKNGGKVYQNSAKAFRKGVRGLDQWVSETSIHKDDK